MTTREIKGTLAKIEKVKIRIGKERDKLRELQDELETVLESLDGADEDITCAMQMFESGIDRLSEQF